MKRNFLGRAALLASVLLLVSACDKRTAEEKGNDLASEKIGIVQGIGNALKEKGAEASEAVTDGVSSVFKGVEKGVVRATDTQIELSEAAKTAGIEISTVQAMDKEGKESHGLDVYILANQALEGKLRAIFYDALGKEIGRASKDIKRAPEEAKYEALTIEKQINLASINKVSFDFKAK